MAQNGISSVVEEISNEQAVSCGASFHQELAYSVQEIVKNDPSHVPKRFIRSDEEREREGMGMDLSHSGGVQTPVLDLALLAKGCDKELMKLHMVCRDWGFFQVINHGVSEKLMQEMKDVGVEFFELPVEEKRKYAMDPIAKQGYGFVFPAASEEQRQDWSDNLLLFLYPSRFRKAELWPATPSQFKDTVEEYSSEVRKVGETLLGCLSLIMGMERSGLVDLHKEITQVMRVNYYPSCCNPDLVMGLSPHSDASTVTILMQDNDIPGLQIQHNQAWLPVNPLPNALVVNIGDIIEILSNGKYKSIEHRAVPSETKARISYATFIYPNEDAEIEPLEQMLDSEKPHKMYKKVKYGDFLKSALQKRLESKSHLEFAKNKP